jgi:hypothetical protein
LKNICNDQEPGKVKKAEANIKMERTPNVLSISDLGRLYLNMAIKAKNGVATPIQYNGDNKGDVSFKKYRVSAKGRINRTYMNHCNRQGLDRNHNFQYLNFIRLRN